ncbi:MAG: GNAT family N-acetyltransferase [Fimbriimonadales bacterium]|nr:GNAT family N-acetyltransferase [Fimbriimonadales bacterium]
MTTLREIAWGSREYAQEVDLRYRLLREPLGLWFRATELEAEEHEQHFGVFEGRRLVACVVARDLGGGVAHLRQMAVDADRQGRGLGARLLSFAEERLAARGFREAVLHARETAVGFYAKAGYRVEGEPFEEVTLPHRRMRKSLTPR